MVRRKDTKETKVTKKRKTAAEKAAESAAAMAEQNADAPTTTEEPPGWYTVRRAAEILDVPVKKIYDGIRDGNLRVRFKENASNGSKTALVSSDALVGSGATANGKDHRKPSSAKIAAEEVVLRELAEKSFQEIQDRLRIADEHLVKERDARLIAERDLETTKARHEQASKELSEERKLRTQLEKDVIKQQSLRDKAEREFENLNRKTAAEEQRLGEHKQLLQRTRSELDSAEDRVEASLKAVYERDVSIAKLEAAVESSQRTKSEGREFSDRLQDRITRLEDRSEEKEKEIRRLALGLGEARGEIRLLRAPGEEEQRLPWRRLRRAVPWLVSIAIGGFVFWLTMSLANVDRPLESGVLAGAGVVAGFAFGFIWERSRRTQ